MFDFKEIRSKFVENPTKRSLLRSIASIYDPLGLISPILVKMKNLFQDVCSSKISWDTELPPEFMSQWTIILQQLEEINKLTIQRKYCFSSVSDPITTVEMHSFSDASKRNFAASIYLRFTLSSGNYKTVLVNSKSTISVINT